MRAEKVDRRDYSGYMVLGIIIRKGEDRDCYNYGQGLISMERHFRIWRFKGVALFTRYASTVIRIQHIKDGYVYGGIGALTGISR